MPCSAVLPASRPRDLERCDPGGLLRAAFVDGGRPVGVRELVVIWLLRLPAEIDPAHAAGCLLAAQGAAPHGDATELRRLLEEIAVWPRERLTACRAASCRPH